MNKDTFYFSHDYNARMDEKIKNLIRKHGIEGYGIFWAIIEDLYCNKNKLKIDYDGIAFDLHTQSDKIKSIIHDFDLFVIEDGFFGSLSVERRLKERNKKTENAKKSALYRWKKSGKTNDANAMRTQCERNANAMRPEVDRNAIKERKGNERKEKDIYKEYKEIFNEFRKNYPGTKRGNDIEFENFIKKHKDWKEVLLLLKERLNYQIEARQVRKQKNLFVPEWKNLQTWINQRCWEEIININS